MNVYSALETAKIFKIENIGPLSILRLGACFPTQKISSCSNALTFTSVQEDLQKKIFDQILIDIFNATVANW